MKNLLIVEDSDPLREQAVQLIESLNMFKVAEAANGEDGLDLLLNNPFDLIVLDYHLPGMTGIDILRKYKEQSGKTPCPVIMLTSEMEARGSEVKSLNVVSWVLKPIVPKRFTDLIEQVAKFYKI